MPAHPMFTGGYKLAPHFEADVDPTLPLSKRLPQHLAEPLTWSGAVPKPLGRQSGGK